MSAFTRHAERAAVRTTWTGNPLPGLGHPPHHRRMVEFRLTQRSDRLIIVRAGDRSRHLVLAANAARGDYDLLVSYFGKDPALYRAPGEQRIDVPGGKFSGLYDTITALGDQIDAYRTVWLLDDDIDVEPETVTHLFDIHERNNLLLSQPSLTPDSHCSHAILKRCAGSALRFTNFVEIMVPVFDRAYLMKVLPLFNGRVTGWGLDLVWHMAVDGWRGRVAVIDRIAVKHGRQIGGEIYAAAAAAGENVHTDSRFIREAFGISWLDIQVHAVRLNDGLTLNGPFLSSAYMLVAHRHGARWLMRRLLKARRNRARRPVEIARLFR